jgi:hypothetical protein
MRVTLTSPTKPEGGNSVPIVSEEENRPPSFAEDPRLALSALALTEAMSVLFVLSTEPGAPERPRPGIMAERRLPNLLTDVIVPDLPNVLEFASARAALALVGRARRDATSFGDTGSDETRGG